MAAKREMSGTVAQLVERMFRIYEARGSTPLCSTFYQIKLAYYTFFRGAQKMQQGIPQCLY